MTNAIVSSSLTSTRRSADIIHYNARQANKANTGLACQGCALSTLCLDSSLADSSVGREPEFLQLVRQGKPIAKGRHVFRQGDAFKSLYVVRAGALKAYNVSSSGIEQVVGFYLPGDIVGFDGLVEERHHSSLIALDTAALCELPFSELDAQLADNEGQRRQFFSLQSAALVQQQRFLLQHCQNTAEEQLAAFLLDISARFKRRHLACNRFRLPMSRKDIASYLGLAVETISRLFSRFQTAGWIDVDGREITLQDLSSFENSKSLSSDDKTKEARRV